MNWRFMDGCSCILDHNCPVSLRVYASRIPPYITMQRVSRVDKRTRLPFRRSLFFLKKKGREGREGNEKKKKQLQVEILQRGERNVAKIATHSAITRSQGTKLEKFLINYVSSRGLFF